MGDDLGKVMVEGNAMAGMMMCEFEKYGGINAHKDNGIDWLLLFY